jgi:hypothetical protein
MNFKDWLQEPIVAVFCIVPLAVVLLGLEIVHVIPARLNRFVVTRRVLWALAVVGMAFFIFVVAARFIELRVS